MFRKNWPNFHSAIEIVTYLQNREKSLHEREQYLERIIRANHGMTRINEAIVMILTQLVKDDSSSLLLNRALSDLTTVKMRKTPTLEFLIHYLSSSERRLEVKDTFLDTLLKSDRTKNLVLAAVKYSEGEISFIKESLSRSLWDNHIHQSEDLSAILRSHHYNLNCLNAAICRLNPSFITLFHHLANPERTNQAKIDYLGHLSKTLSGENIINNLQHLLTCSSENFDINIAATVYNKNESSYFKLHGYDTLPPDEISEIISSFRKAQLPSTQASSATAYQGRRFT